MDSPQSFTFKKLVLDPLTLQPIYKTAAKDLVLCEVYTGVGHATKNVYITTESLSLIGVLPEQMNDDLYISSDDEVTVARRRRRYTDESRVSEEEDFKFNDGDRISGFIWSARHVTREDNNATVMFLNLVTSQKYSEPLNDGSVQRYKIWQQIAQDLSKEGYVVAKNAIEGGERCHQMWKYLNSEFHGIGESFKSNTTNNRKRKLASLLKKKQKEKADEPLPNTSTSVEEEASDPDELGHASGSNLNNNASPPQGDGDGMSMLDALVNATRHVKELETMQNENIEELGEEERSRHEERLKTIAMLEEYLSTEAKKRKRSDQ